MGDAAAQRHDLEHLVGAASADTERLAQTLLGAPTEAGRKTWRYGRRGSFSIEVHGPKRGRWFDHEAQEGGGPLHLVERQLGGSRREAVAWLKSFVGFDDQAPAPVPAAQRPTPADDRRDEQEEDARRLRKARAIASKGVTAAEADAALSYFKGRGIAAKPPACLRFSEDPRDLEGNATGAIIAVATAADGEVRAVQRIYVRDGRKANVDGLPSAKRSNGLQDGAAVRLPGPNTGPLVLAEGPETGLSVWQATGHETWIALGSIAKLHPARGRELIVARDADAPDSPADRTLRKALDQLAEAGHRIHVATPAKRGDDWNDVLQRGGNVTVADGIAAAELYAEGPTRPTYPNISLPVEEARARIDPVIRRFLERQAAYRLGQADADAEPPQIAAFIDMGLGKSDAARRHIAWFVADHNTRSRYTSDDEAAKAHRDLKRGVIATATHELAREYVMRLQQLGVSVAHWRGRDHDDPETGEAVCQDRKSVQQAIAIGQPPEQAVCRRTIKHADGTKTTVHCPFHPDSGEAAAGGPTCIYQKQKPDAKNADVVVTTHAALFEERPNAIGERAWMVIDEDFTGQGLRGVSGPQQPLAVMEFGARAQVLDKHGTPQFEESRKLSEARATVGQQMNDQDLGPVDLNALREADVTSDQLRAAARREEQTRVPAPMYPGMSRRERYRIYQDATYNASVPYRSRTFRLLADAMEAGQDVAAGVEVVERHSEEGAPMRGIRLRWRAEIRAGWPDATLLLDGTGNEDVSRWFLPRLEVADRITAQTPHVTVRQVYDKPFSAHMLHPGERAREKDQQTARRHVRDLHAYIQARARAFDTGRTDGAPDVLVICQQAAKAELRELGLRANVEVAHFNAVRGLDRWRDVRAVIVVGRTLPAATAIEAHYTALTNRQPNVRPAHVWWYDKTTRALRMADGTGLPIEADRHPDPLCEAIRWGICDAELVQAIARGRGVNRTADTPLQVDVLADVVLPLTVHEAVTWEEVRPGPFDLMFATGLAVENAADAARLRPDLWKTQAAARQAFTRARSVTHAYDRASLYRTLSHSSGGPEGAWRSGSARYQRAAAGAKVGRAHFDPKMLREPAMILEAAIGELVRFESEDSARHEATVATLTASRSPAKAKETAMPQDESVHREAPARPTLAERWRSGQLRADLLAGRAGYHERVVREGSGEPVPMQRRAHVERLCPATPVTSPLRHGRYLRVLSSWPADHPARHAVARALARGGADPGSIDRARRWVAHEPPPASSPPRLLVSTSTDVAPP